jgi:DNA-binding MarR family transcriptional regulator
MPTTKVFLLTLPDSLSHGVIFMHTYQWICEHSLSIAGKWYSSVMEEMQAMAILHPGYAHITSRQLEVLEFLARREQWQVGEVASVLGISSAAATKAIARLERKGLVTRSVDVMDRRCVNVRITRAGGDALRQIVQPVAL